MLSNTTAGKNSCTNFCQSRRLLHQDQRPGNHALHRRCSRCISNDSNINALALFKDIRDDDGRVLRIEWHRYIGQGVDEDSVVILVVFEARLIIWLNEDEGDGLSRMRCRRVRVEAKAGEVLVRRWEYGIIGWTGARYDEVLSDQGEDLVGVGVRSIGRPCERVDVPDVDKSPSLPMIK